MFRYVTCMYMHARCSHWTRGNSDECAARVDHPGVDCAAGRDVRGYSLLQFLNRENAFTPFQVTWFRAGHAHAGVLVLMSLLYYSFMEKTSFSPVIKHVACAVLLVGILAQSGGFFVHMLVGHANRASIGNAITVVGALLLVCAIAVLVYGLITTN